jgi:hypothetical protein
MSRHGVSPWMAADPAPPETKNRESWCTRRVNSRTVTIGRNTDLFRDSNLEQILASDLGSLLIGATGPYRYQCRNDIASFDIRNYSSVSPLGTKAREGTRGVTAAMLTSFYLEQAGNQLRYHLLLQ